MAGTWMRGGHGRRDRGVVGGAAVRCGLTAGPLREPGGPGGDRRLVDVGHLLDVVDQPGDRRRDPVEDRLRVDAEQHDQDDQRGDHDALGPAQVTGGGAAGRGGRPWKACW